MANKKLEKIILGSLMKNPLLLAESDRFSLSIDDFDDRLTQHIFYAIASIAQSGSTKIKVQDVHLFLQTTPTGLALFDSNNGIALLNDAMELANDPSFGTYYNLFKKENLLRDLRKMGYDTKEFYDINPITQQEIKINDKYNSLELKDIIEVIKMKLLGLESTYLTNDATETQDVFEGMEELIAELEVNPDIGVPIQGDIFNTAIAGARKGALYIRSGSSGVSKALPHSTIIPTPSGQRTVGDIRTGDILFDRLGQPTKVLGIAPQGKKDVYELTLKDGRKARCSNDHLWTFQRKSHGKWITDTQPLQYLIDKQKSIGLTNKNGASRFRIPLNSEVEYPKKNYYLNPYVMGAFLGDGSFRQNERNKAFQFSSKDKEIVEHIAELMGWTAKKNIANNFTWTFESDQLVSEYKEPQKQRKNIWVEEVLCEYPELIGSYSHNKYIPKEYLEGDVNQRYQLLQGLLDTDGFVDQEKGRVSFSSISRQLIADITTLCYSLGMTATMSTIYDIERYIGSNGYCYVLHIQASIEQKTKIFYLKRKQDKVLKELQKEKRREDRTHITIIDIKKLDYQEEMTCFRVDNDEHLFLMNDYIVTHNTRQAIGDACYLAFPIRYNPKRCVWEQNGYNEKVLIIVTEQSFKEVRTMILAYLTGLNEKKIKRLKTMTAQERVILSQATYVLEKFRINMHIVRMPSPSIQVVKTIVRQNVLLHDIEYVFYDYIFVGPSLLEEFRGFSLRNDEVLLMFSTALKDLAVELKIFMMSSTQVNASADDNKNIRNEGSIAGARSIINKADVGCIMARPTNEELTQLKSLIEETGILEPNVVTDLFKNRGDEWTQVRIWTFVDMGNLRKQDLFITNSRLEAIDDFKVDSVSYEVPFTVVGEYLTNLNKKG